MARFADGVKYFSGKLTVAEARQGRHSVAHGASRGNRISLRLSSAPAGAAESLAVADYFCRPCRGLFFNMPLLPMADAMGHILSPLRGL